MEYHLSGMNLPLQNENMTPKVLLSAADKHLARVLRKNPINLEDMYSPNRLSFIESNIGIATLVLERGPWTSEQTIVDNWQAAKDYLELHPADKEDRCEVLYGRAGMVYALLHLRKAIGGQPQNEMASLDSLVSDITLSRLVDSIMVRGRHGAHALSSEFRMSGGPDLPPLMWMWHGKRYLGGAHGVAGILQTLLNCPTPIIQKHLADIFHTVAWLVDCQDEAGNWPTKCPTQREVSGGNDLVQWCHGASGMLILLATALRVLHDQKDMIATNNIEDKLRNSLHLGANFVCKHGLLRKGVGLCHGVAGSVYALLAASDVLDTSVNKQIFAKAAHLAFLATFRDDMTASKDMVIPDHPWSMYEGLAGACCAWAEVLCRLDSQDSRRSSSGFPAYDDLLS
ncbi:hypothetical protein BDZ97DRAFT_1905851 [Flammula alnicola]|nr:hypothetical protein BDZ97DRAFT_1905851 [Flammula alnicola]